ncbi:MAG: VWA domain-containing protein [Planctomycetota bacterium]|nr:VWA domain-containing protein [Planctomycetota bacterium]
MYSKPNSNSNSVGNAIRAFAAVMIVLIILSRLFTCDHATTTSSPSPRPATGYQQVASNPILDQLQPPPDLQRTDGTALAILIDVSGSMSDPVPDANNQRRPKIDIAKRSVLSLLTQADQFIKAHPDRPLLIGLYEFSSRPGQPSCRTIIPLSTPNLASAQSALAQMRPNGGTPIGDAIIHVKRDLDRTAKSRLHILVLTDGENNQGYNPPDVMNAISRLSEDARPATYFIAFDIAAEKFKQVRDSGALVLSAANEPELRQTLDYLLTGKILAEQPPTPQPR